MFVAAVALPALVLLQPEAMVLIFLIIVRKRLQRKLAFFLSASLIANFIFWPMLRGPTVWYWAILTFWLPVLAVWLLYRFWQRRFGTRNNGAAALKKRQSPRPGTSLE
jgi:hypothetical protein